MAEDDDRKIKASKESTDGLLNQLIAHGYIKHAKLIKHVLKDNFAEARKVLNELNQDNINKLNS